MGSDSAPTIGIGDPPSLPAIHGLHLAQLVERWHVSLEDLLGDIPILPAELSDPAARMPLSIVERIIGRARALTGEPGLGIYLGLHMRISAHGYVGFAAMTASNLREALEIGVRFTPTLTNTIALRLHVEERVASLVVEELHSFGTARDFIVFSLLYGYWQMGNAITGRELDGNADFAFPEPSYFSRFVRVARGEIRFSQPANRLVFDARLLNLPLTMADPAALRLATEQCERELDALGYEGHVVARVRALLPSRQAGFRTLDEIAKQIHVSPRTLKRKLADDGTSYSELLEEQRRERAMLLLRSRELSVEEVAERLGYSDSANFTRAFRRWTGRTPNAFRHDASRSQR